MDTLAKMAARCKARLVCVMFLHVLRIYVLCSSNIYYIQNNFEEDELFTSPESEGSKTNPLNRFLTVKNTILFLIGVPSQFSHNGLSDWLTGKALKREGTPFTLCDTVKTCYEATNGEVTFELFLKVHLSTTLYWLWEKSPDLRQKVSIVKKHVFLESTSRVEATSQSWTREGHFVEAKLCKVTSIPDVELDGG